MGKLAKTVYAEALFSLGQERGETETLMEEIRGLRTVLRENVDFCRIMRHPQVVKTEKCELLARVFSGRVSDTMLGFLQLVTEKNHFGVLPDSFDVYETLWQKKHNIGIAHITSAMPLTEEQKANIHKRLLQTTHFSTVEEQYAVEPALIGGVTIRIGDRVVDGSVRHRLDRLTSALMGAS